MALTDDEKRKLLKRYHAIDSGEEIQDDDSGSTSSGGQGGAIEFRDFTASQQHIREDMLPEDQKRLLSVHKDTHELRVKKQKDLRDLRNQLKDGKINQERYRDNLAQAGLGAGNNSAYKANPILANKAQFAGIDKQENPLPGINEANTNEGNRNELENRYQLRNAPKSAPVFHPKPLR